MRLTFTAMFLQVYVSEGGDSLTWTSPIGGKPSGMSLIPWSEDDAIIRDRLRMGSSDVAVSCHSRVLLLEAPF